MIQEEVSLRILSLQELLDKRETVNSELFLEEYERRKVLVSEDGADEDKLLWYLTTGENMLDVEIDNTLIVTCINENIDNGDLELVLALALDKIHEKARTKVIKKFTGDGIFNYDIDNIEGLVNFRFLEKIRENRDVLEYLFYLVSSEDDGTYGILNSLISICHLLHIKIPTDELSEFLDTMLSSTNVLEDKMSASNLITFLQVLHSQ